MGNRGIDTNVRITHVVGGLDREDALYMWTTARNAVTRFDKYRVYPEDFPETKEAVLTHEGIQEMVEEKQAAHKIERERDDEDTKNRKNRQPIGHEEFEGLKRLIDQAKSKTIDEVTLETYGTLHPDLLEVTLLPDGAILIDIVPGEPATDKDESRGNTAAATIETAEARAEAETLQARILPWSEAYASIFENPTDEQLATEIKRAIEHASVIPSFYTGAERNNDTRSYGDLDIVTGNEAEEVTVSVSPDMILVRSSDDLARALRIGLPILVEENIKRRGEPPLTGAERLKMQERIEQRVQKAILHEQEHANGIGEDTDESQYAFGIFFTIEESDGELGFQEFHKTGTHQTKLQQAIVGVFPDIPSEGDMATVKDKMGYQHVQDVAERAIAYNLTHEDQYPVPPAYANNRLLYDLVREKMPAVELNYPIDQVLRDSSFAETFARLWEISSETMQSLEAWRKERARLAGDLAYLQVYPQEPTWPDGKSVSSLSEDLAFNTTQSLDQVVYGFIAEDPEAARLWTKVIVEVGRVADEQERRAIADNLSFIRNHRDGLYVTQVDGLLEQFEQAGVDIRSFMPVEATNQPEVKDEVRETREAEEEQITWMRWSEFEAAISTEYTDEELMDVMREVLAHAPVVPESSDEEPESVLGDLDMISPAYGDGEVAIGVVQGRVYVRTLDELERAYRLVQEIRYEDAANNGLSPADVSILRGRIEKDIDAYISEMLEHEADHAKAGGSDLDGPAPHVFAINFARKKGEPVAAIYPSCLTGVPYTKLKLASMYAYPEDPSDGGIDGDMVIVRKLGFRTTKEVAERVLVYNLTHDKKYAVPRQRTNMQLPESIRERVPAVKLTDSLENVFRDPALAETVARLREISPDRIETADSLRKERTQLASDIGDAAYLQVYPPENGDIPDITETAEDLRYVEKRGLENLTFGIIDVNSEAAQLWTEVLTAVVKVADEDEKKKIAEELLFIRETHDGQFKTRVDRLLEQFEQAGVDIRSFMPGEIAAPNKGAEAALAEHDKSVKKVFGRLAHESLGGPTHDETASPEELELEDQLRTIFHIGEKLDIHANGLLGYYTPVVTEASETDTQNARRNLVSVLTEGKVRPAGEVILDSGPKIDREGNLINGSELQAFCAPLKLGNLYDSSGQFGPYWIVFHPEATASDRWNGIPVNLHQFYLVPDDKDRDFVVRESLHRGVQPEVLGKIITYEEFIAMHEGELDPDWKATQRIENEKASRARKEAEDVRRQVIQLPSLAEADDVFLIHILDEQNDPLLREQLVRDINFLPSYVKADYGNQEARETFERKNKEAFMRLLRDDNTPENIRVACLGKVKELDEFFTEEDRNALLTLMRDKEQSSALRLALMSAVGPLHLHKDANRALKDIAMDPQESIEARHTALFRMREDGQEFIDTCLYYLQTGNEQGQKIAMNKLASSYLFDPGEEILRAVEEFAVRNERVDIQDYLDQFSEKYSYITHPERYAKYIPQSWERFVTRVKARVADFTLEGDERDDMTKGLLAYLYGAVKSGEVLLSEGGYQRGDLVLRLFNQTDVAILKERNSTMIVDTGKNTTELFRPLTYYAPILKRIIHVTGEYAARGAEKPVSVAEQENSASEQRLKTEQQDGVTWSEFYTSIPESYTDAELAAAIRRAIDTIPLSDTSYSGSEVSSGMKYVSDLLELVDEFGNVRIMTRPHTMYFRTVDELKRAMIMAYQIKGAVLNETVLGDVLTHENEHLEGLATSPAVGDHAFGFELIRHNKDSKFDSFTASVHIGRKLTKLERAAVTAHPNFLYFGMEERGDIISLRNMGFKDIPDVTQKLKLFNSTHRKQIPLPLSGEQAGAQAREAYEKFFADLAMHPFEQVFQGLRPGTEEAITQLGELSANRMEKINALRAERERILGDLAYIEATMEGRPNVMFGKNQFSLKDDLSMVEYYLIVAIAGGVGEANHKAGRLWEKVVLELARAAHKPLREQIQTAVYLNKNQSILAKGRMNRLYRAIGAMEDTQDVTEIQIFGVDHPDNDL